MALFESYERRIAKIEEVLGKKVKFASDCRGEIAKEAASNLQNGEILAGFGIRWVSFRCDFTHSKNALVL